MFIKAAIKWTWENLAISMFLIDNKTLLEIKEGYHIPAKPELLTKIQQLHTDQQYDVQEAANIVMKDVELSGDILKAINSAFFGLKTKISDIHQAAVILGFQNIYQITVACLVKNAFYQKNQVSCISLERFWDEAMETAAIAMHIANESKHTISTADAYALGLFHDSGIAAMSMRYEQYQDVLEAANNSDLSELDEIEQSVFNCSHTLVGYVLAMSWDVPQHICEIIARHHEKSLFDSLTDERQQCLAAVLMLAQNIVATRHNDRPLPMWQDVKSTVLDVLGFTEEHYKHFIEQ